MEIFKSNGPMWSFYPNLSQNFLYTQIVQGVPFKYLKWKNSIQMDSGGICWNNKWKNDYEEISELRNWEILFSLKIPSYEKLAMTWQFDLTQFYDAIIRNSVFKSFF